MVIYKEFSTSAEVAEAVEFVVIGDTVVKQYPSIAIQVARNLVSALHELGIAMTYNQTTFEACIGTAKFHLICDDTTLSIFWQVGEEWMSCSVAHSGVVTSDFISCEFAIRVMGTSNSFEVSVGVQDFFGIYTLERAWDDKKLTAIRMNESRSKFAIFEDWQILELGKIIVPSADHPSKFSASGVTLVPAVTTNFAYRIMDAFLFIPFLQTGTYYEIADFSVVAVASCVLLRY